MTENSLGLFRSNFDGSNQTKILPNISLVDVDVWPERNSVCFLSRNRTAVECANFEGTEVKILAEFLYENLTNLAFGDEKLFYYHLALRPKSKQGGIVVCDPKIRCEEQQQNITSFSADNETFVVDLKIFSKNFKLNQKNKCGEKNGNCEQICFYFGGDRKKCDCAFGKLAPDGLSCSPHDAFLVYSKVIVFF